MKLNDSPNLTADNKITRDRKIELLSSLLMSEPQTLIAVGLGSIVGGDMADHLLKLAKQPTPRRRPERG